LAESWTVARRNAVNAVLCVGYIFDNPDPSLDFWEWLARTFQARAGYAESVFRNDESVRAQVSAVHVKFVSQRSTLRAARAPVVPDQHNVVADPAGVDQKGGLAFEQLLKKILTTGASIREVLARGGRG
jgi:hypothetical protein